LYNLYPPLSKTTAGGTNDSRGLAGFDPAPGGGFEIAAAGFPTTTEHEIAEVLRGAVEGIIRVADIPPDTLIVIEPVVTPAAVQGVEDQKIITPVSLC
jgi:hypothetical protein